MTAKRDKLYTEFRRLRIQGFLIGDAARALGVTIQTGSRYEKRYKAENLPTAIDKLEKRLIDVISSKEGTADQLSKMADALTKLHAIWRKT